MGNYITSYCKLTSKWDKSFERKCHISYVNETTKVDVTMTTTLLLLRQDPVRLILTLGSTATLPKLCNNTSWSLRPSPIEARGHLEVGIVWTQFIEGRATTRSHITCWLPKPSRNDSVLFSGSLMGRASCYSPEVILAASNVCYNSYHVSLSYDLELGVCTATQAC